LVGQSVLAEGNAAVIEQMRAAGALWRHTEFAHRYPVDWRTKKPIIQRACEQWFCRLEALAPEARRALEKVTLVPAQGAAQLSAVVGSRTEWCISRQRHWGMPIPVFYDSETGAPLLTRESVQHVASLVAEHGSGCWWTLPVEELLPPSHRQNGRTYVRGLDTMDVWFDSGVAWRASLQPRGIGVGTPTEKVELQIPAVDVVLEGEDQYRGWFQSLLLTGVACTGQAPYRTVVTHGFVLDEQGRKMSKSLGNVFDPNVAIVGVPSEVPSLAEPGAVPEVHSRHHLFFSCSTC
jgi:isoleucyl-tRNA synthetase